MDQSSQPRVLVVDDELSNLKTFRRAFRGQVDVTLALGADEALVVARERTFDVALVDYCMPVMNGVELLGRLAGLRPTMRRALLTGYGGLEEVQRALAEGLCERIIDKPFERDALLDYLRAAAKERLDG